MPDVNKQLLSLSTMHQHDLEQYKTGLYREALSYFIEMLDKFKIEIDKYSGTWSPEKKNRLVASLNSIREKQFNEMYKFFTKEIRDFSGEETKFISRQIHQVMRENGLKVTISYADKAKIYGQVANTKLALEDGSYRTFLGTWNLFARRVKEKLEQTVRQDIDYGKEPSEVKSDATSRGSSFYRNSTFWMRSTTDTLLQHAAGIAAYQTYLANTRYISGYMWNSVMDSATTEICQHLNNKTWFYGQPELGTMEGPWVPPQHFKCRSTTTPIIRSAAELGIENGNFSGKAPEQQTYTEWLGEQSSETQLKVLGRVRYDMYKSGTAIKAFYTGDNRMLTLKQLQRRNLTIPKEYLKFVK